MNHSVFEVLRKSGYIQCATTMSIILHCNQFPKLNFNTLNDLKQQQNNKVWMSNVGFPIIFTFMITVLKMICKALLKCLFHFNSFPMKLIWLDTLEFCRCWKVDWWWSIKYLMQVWVRNYKETILQVKHCWFWNDLFKFNFSPTT